VNTGALSPRADPLRLPNPSIAMFVRFPPRFEVPAG